MTVIAAFLYRNGQRVREVAIDEKVDCERDKSEFVWIGLADPTEEELRTHLLDSVSYLAIPTRWEIRLEPLPTLAGEKVDKKALSGRFAN